MMRSSAISLRQTGMVLLVSLVFLLMLSLIALASMQGAVAQQKMSGSVWHRNQSFQTAESGLRLGEAIVRKAAGTLPPCQSISTCAPPQEAYAVVSGGANAASAVTWVSVKGGVYGLQSLGRVDLPTAAPAALYRVTAVGLNGQARTVLETVYARMDEGDGVRFRRILWRQLQ
ncbi:PilX N-terminal domain-containing pilus assembly protein [Pseudomonas sp.]|uniref:pilus assembly PilX family protein n=1 Tax=Pseudomonas sp. TaxID=306 RepID=UPI0032677E88